MEKNDSQLIHHPQYLDALFAFKSGVSNIFRDVIGLHEIAHLAVDHINSDNELVSFSSTPALEFNLFHSKLWQFDQTYSLAWIRQCQQADWRDLVDPARFDEVIYSKQIQHGFVFGTSMAARLGDGYVVYSFASRKSGAEVIRLFHENVDEFYRIGKYCTNQFLPYLERLGFHIATIIA